MLLQLCRPDPRLIQIVFCVTMIRSQEGMMGALLRNSVLVMFVWLMLAGICFGKQVYLSDGSSIDCESFWRRGDKVVVKINRDTVLEFARNQIDERRTFVKAVKKTRPVKRKKIAARVTTAKAATFAGVAEAAPAPAAAPAVTPAVNQVPAPAQAPPVTEPTVQPEAVQPAPPAPAPVSLEQQPAIPQIDAPSAGSVVTILLVLGALGLFIIIAMWVVFTKAGQAGWKSLIPIYNIYILLVIAGVPGWWLIMFFIPFVGLVFHLLAMLALAKKFGKGTLFGIGLFFLPMFFYPLLAFGGARYEG